MLAIYRGRLYHVADDDGRGVFLEWLANVEPGEGVYVEYGEPTLVIDPTDDEVEQARAEKLPEDYEGANRQEAISELADLLDRLGQRGVFEMQYGPLLP